MGMLLRLWFFWSFMRLLNFIVMIGYPMAKNLRLKMPTCNKLVILDVNTAVMNQFVQEINATANNTGLISHSIEVEIAQNAREVAEKSVSGFIPTQFFDPPWSGYFPGFSSSVVDNLPYRA